MDFRNSYGYDEIFVDNTEHGMYPDYIKSLVQPTEDSNKEKSVQSQRMQLPPQRPNMMDHAYNYSMPKYKADSSDVQMYKSKVMLDEFIIDDLRKKLSDYQSKHDIFLIFIICLITYIMICNSQNQHMKYYIHNNQPMMQPISTV